MLPPTPIFQPIESWNISHPALFNSVVARELPYPWNQSTTPFSWASFTMHTTGVSFAIGSLSTLLTSVKILYDTRRLPKMDRRRLAIVRLLRNGAFIPGFTFLGMFFSLKFEF